MIRLFSGLPQHPWIRRMWLQLRDQYYSKYPHAVPRISAGVSRTPQMAASAWQQPSACNSLDLRDYIGPPAPTPPPSLTRGRDERSGTPSAVPDASRDGGVMLKSHREENSDSSASAKTALHVRPSELRADPAVSGKTACAISASSALLEASQRPSVTAGLPPASPSSETMKEIPAVECPEAVARKHPPGQRGSTKLEQEATVGPREGAQGKESPGASSLSRSSEADMMRRLRLRFAGGSTWASSLEKSPAQFFGSHYEAGNDGEGVGRPTPTIGSGEGPKPRDPPTLQTGGSGANSLVSSFDFHPDLQQSLTASCGASENTKVARNAYGTTTVGMPAQAPASTRLAPSTSAGSLPVTRDKAGPSLEAAQEATVDDPSVSLASRRGKKTAVTRSLSRSGAARVATSLSQSWLAPGSGSSSNVTQPQSSILTNIGHTVGEKGQVWTQGEVPQGSGTCSSHVPVRPRRGRASASVGERTHMKATATLGQDSTVSAKKVLFSSKVSDANDSGSSLRPRSPPPGRRNPGAPRKTLRGAQKSMDRAKEQSPSKTTKSPGSSSKVVTGTSRRQNQENYHTKHTTLRPDTWKGDAGGRGQDRSEDRYGDRAHTTTVSLGATASMKAKGETEDGVLCKRVSQLRRTPSTDQQSMKPRQSQAEGAQTPARTKASAGGEQAARATSCLQLSSQPVSPGVRQSSSSYRTGPSEAGSVQPRGPSPGVADDARGIVPSSLVLQDPGLEESSSEQSQFTYPLPMSLSLDDRGRVGGSPDGLPVLCDPWSAGGSAARPLSQISHESGELDCFADHLSVGSAGDDLLVPTAEYGSGDSQAYTRKKSNSASTKRKSGLASRRLLGAGPNSSPHQEERSAAPFSNQRRPFSADPGDKGSRGGGACNRSSSAQTGGQNGGFPRLPARGLGSCRLKGTSDVATAYPSGRQEGGTAASISRTGSELVGTGSEVDSASQQKTFDTSLRIEAGTDVGAGGFSTRA